MKVKDKYSTSTKLIFEYAPYGFWKYIVLKTDPWYTSYAKDMSIGWYLQHSWYKTLSPFFEICEAEYDTDPAVESEDFFEAVGSVVRSKFIDKWTRIYEALNAEYDPIETNSGSRGYTNKHTYDITDTGDSSVTYGKKVTDTGKTDTTSTDQTEAGIYGFNSTTAVDSNVSKGNGTRSTTDNGTTQQSGADSSESTKKKQGTETITRSEQFSYRDKSGAELTQEEVDLRIKNVFFDIVMNDVDSIVCLNIYD